MLDKILGSIIGSACGDTLGRATEFMREYEVIEYYGKPIKDFETDRLGVFNYGEYTDDTYLMMCIANSLVEKGDFDINDICDKFIYWYRTNGKDCGNLTSDAISLMIDGFEPLDSGKHAWEMSGKTSAGNGGLMRNTAIPLFYRNDFDKMLEVTEKVCKTTHFDNRCVLSCLAHSIAIYAILHDQDVFDSVFAYCGERDDEFDDLLYEARDCSIDEFKLDGRGQGYTYLSLKVALCAVLNYDNFEEPIIEIVNKGGDADTNACIAGSLLGAKFGLDAIPFRWQNDLIGYYDLETVGNKIYQMTNLSLK